MILDRIQPTDTEKAKSEVHAMNGESRKKKVRQNIMAIHTQFLNIANVLDTIWGRLVSLTALILAEHGCPSGLRGQT